MNATLSSREVIERENLSKGVFDERLLAFSIRTGVQSSLTLYVLACTLFSPGAGQARQDSVVPSNTPGISFSNNIEIGANPIYPTIDEVLPNPVPSANEPQVLVINGKEFHKGCRVVVRDKTTKEVWRDFKMGVCHMSQIVVTPNFGKAEHDWSIEVVNPGGFSSGEFMFNVVTPENLWFWHWRRGGWPWFWGSAICGAGLVAVLVLRHRHAGTAIAGAAETARRHEHERISGDLHDSVNDLNEVNLLAEKLKVISKNDGDVNKIRETADSVSIAVVEAVNALEDMIWSSGPGHENLESLVARLRDKIGRFRQSYLNLNCELKFPIAVPQMRVSSYMSAHLLRLTSEALRNIIRHADAHCVNCRLSIQNARLLLEIADDGCGFDQHASRTSGQGLPSLRRRAEELGGSFTIQSSPGNGTKIGVEVPLHDIPRYGG
jgi:hypothetical protein